LGQDNSRVEDVTQKFTLKIAENLVGKHAVIVFDFEPIDASLKLLRY